MSEKSKIERLKQWIGTRLIRFGHKLYYVHEIYGAGEGILEGEVWCARCRYCGASTQTTDRKCWKCR